MTGQGGDGMTSAAEKSKRSKAKGAPHGLHYEILDDPNIKAESDWEKEEAEYWSSKMCKKYVKMYHIDKLWPRESHARHTHDYSCKPWTCNNKHFVHRSNEVWKALFGEGKAMCKGYINYSLASMVYAELILVRKVDWSTFPTTSLAPLLLERNQRDIPDLFDEEAQASEPPKPTNVSNTTATPTTMVDGGASHANDAMKLDSIPLPTKVRNVSSRQSGGAEGEVFLTPPTCLISSPIGTTADEQSIVPTKEKILPECGEPSFLREEVEEEQVAEANATIDGLLDNDALDVLTHESLKQKYLPTTSSPIFTGALEVHVPLESGERLCDVAMNSTLDTAEIERKHPHLSSLRTEQLQLLRTMPNAKELEDLVRVASRWRELEKEQGNRKPDNEPGTSSEVEQQVHFGDFVGAAYRMSCSARNVAEITPVLMEMADDFSKLSPELLTGALSFIKFPSPWNQFLTTMCRSCRSWCLWKKRIKSWLP